MHKRECHGHAGKDPLTKKYRASLTYSVWQSMRKRCMCKTNKDYSRYGGRGITICERWDSFGNFLADMGEQPAGLTLERINNDGNYEPSNCRWATWEEQRKNQRSSYKFIEFSGERLSVGDWNKKLGLQKGGVWHRLKNGWSLEKALTTPVVRKAE